MASADSQDEREWLEWLSWQRDRARVHGKWSITTIAPEAEHLLDRFSSPWVRREIHSILGQAARERGDLDLAIEQFLLAHALADADAPGGWFGRYVCECVLGNASAERGDPDAARNWYVTALRTSSIDPCPDQWAVNGLLTVAGGEDRLTAAETELCWDAVARAFRSLNRPEPTDLSLAEAIASLGARRRDDGG